jgi:hypothetical protein
MVIIVTSDSGLGRGGVRELHLVPGPQGSIINKAERISRTAVPEHIFWYNDPNSDLQCVPRTTEHDVHHHVACTVSQLRRLCTNKIISQRLPAFGLLHSISLLYERLTVCENLLHTSGSRDSSIFYATHWRSDFLGSDLCKGLSSRFLHAMPTQKPLPLLLQVLRFVSRGTSRRIATLNINTPSCVEAKNTRNLASLPLHPFTAKGRW